MPEQPHQQTEPRKSKALYFLIGLIILFIVISLAGIGILFYFMNKGFDVAVSKTESEKQAASSAAENSSQGSNTSSVIATSSPVSDAKLSVPNNAELIALTKKNVYDLAVAINSGNFDDFYATISNAWQSQTSPSKLRDSFSAFIRIKDDMSSVKDMNPTFTSAAYIDTDKMLHADGNFTNSAGDKLSFTTKYVFENGNWKLMGIYLNQATSKSFTLN